MRRAVFGMALVLLLSMGTLSPIAAVSPSVVTVLSDGTGDSVNLRSEPSMDGSIVGHAKAGDTLMLYSETIVTANGWQWWAIDTAPGTVYVRSDLVSAPKPQSGQTSQTSGTRPNANLTNTPRDTIPDFIIWAVPQSLGGFLMTTCDAHYVSISIRYAGASDCYTVFVDSMDAVTAHVTKEQQNVTYRNVVFLSEAPDPPRIYLQGVFTAIGYTDGGTFLAQGLTDTMAVNLVGVVAQQACGYSCHVSVDYYYQQ